MSRASRPVTGFIGAGRLTRSLLPLLAAAGYPIAAVAAPRQAAARTACQGVAGVRSTTDLASAVRGVELVLLAVPDRAVEDVAADLVGATPHDWPGRVVLHHAGALGPEALRALARRGASTGVFHPLQALADPGSASLALAGSRVRIEGDPAASRMARRLARDLELVPLRIGPLAPAQRSAYHAAASLLSNDLLALLSIGVDLLESLGLKRVDAVRALGALGRGTLTQAERRGLGATLTGPVVRGDAATLAAHLARLSRDTGDAAEIHRMLSRRLLQLARREKRPLAAEAERGLRKLLEPRETGRR